jgi:hypothetical protein
MVFAMNQREERLLIAIAQQYAPAVLQQWNRGGTLEQRLANLARELANYNILVIMADQPYSLQSLNDDARLLTESWIKGYTRLYTRLCEDLFPSLRTHQVYYTDGVWPVMIYIVGAATPVIQQIAGYIAPYVVERQFALQISEAELIGVMDMMLDELEAASLPRERYKQLRADGVELLRQMIANPLNQLPLTDFDRPIFSDSQRIVPPTLPPSSLPEPPRQLRQSETQQLDPTMPITPPEPPPDLPPDLPRTWWIYSDRDDDDDDRRPRPPVPPLPSRSNSN